MLASVAFGGFTSSMALPQRIPELDPSAEPGRAQRIRRCTFRRLSRITADPEAAYEVSCLYPDRRVPLPIGDIESASPICAACTADHIFRPDED
jgi:hypothetical protein